MTALVPIEPYARDSIESLADLAVQSLPSPHSRRAYRSALTRYLSSGRPLSREGVQMYLNERRDQGAGKVTLNILLSAIKLLARESEVRGLLSASDLVSIERIKSSPIRGSRNGNWLDLKECELLLDATELSKTKGKRNKAMIALMIGSGLRRSELSELRWDQYQRRDGRTVIVDIVGKGERVRTVPVPRWVEYLIEEWKEEAT